MKRTDLFSTGRLEAIFSCVLRLGRVRQLPSAPDSHAVLDILLFQKPSLPTSESDSWRVKRSLVRTRTGTQPEHRPPSADALVGCSVVSPIFR